MTSTLPTEPTILHKKKLDTNEICDMNCTRKCFIETNLKNCFEDNFENVRHFYFQLCENDLFKYNDDVISFNHYYYGADMELLPEHRISPVVPFLGGFASLVLGLSSSLVVVPMACEIFPISSNDVFLTLLTAYWAGSAVIGVAIGEAYNIYKEKVITNKKLPFYAGKVLELYYDNYLKGNTKALSECVVMRNRNKKPFKCPYKDRELRFE